MWLDLLERLVRDQEAGSSNLLTPTISTKRLSEIEGRCFYALKYRGRFCDFIEYNEPKTLNISVLFIRRPCCYAIIEKRQTVWLSK